LAGVNVKLPQFFPAKPPIALTDPQQTAASLASAKPGTDSFCYLKGSFYWRKIPITANRPALKEKKLLPGVRTEVISPRAWRAGSGGLYRLVSVILVGRAFKGEKSNHWKEFWLQPSMISQ
jgi:hypothetical protein